MLAYLYAESNTEGAILACRDPRQLMHAAIHLMPTVASFVGLRVLSVQWDHSGEIEVLPEDQKSLLLGHVPALS